jgi:hypothetical protein
MLPGGGMEGQSIENCIWEQKRINLAYYESMRNGEVAQQGTTAPTAKKARIENADGDEHEETKEGDDDEAEDETDAANVDATNQWYHANSNMLKISIDENMMETTEHDASDETQHTTDGTLTMTPQQWYTTQQLETTKDDDDDKMQEEHEETKEGDDDTTTSLSPMTKKMSECNIMMTKISIDETLLTTTTTTIDCGAQQTTITPPPTQRTQRQGNQCIQCRT